MVKKLHHISPAGPLCSCLCVCRRWGETQVGRALQEAASCGVHHTDTLHSRGTQPQHTPRHLQHKQWSMWVFSQDVGRSFNRCVNWPEVLVLTSPFCRSDEAWRSERCRWFLLFLRTPELLLPLPWRFRGSAGLGCGDGRYKPSINKHTHTQIH